MAKASIINAKTRVSKQNFAIGILLVAFFILCFTSRLIPSPILDRSIFVSVAEYLLSGHQLYIDVYDNKDPLFYYAVSMQRLLGPGGEYLFELLMVAIAAVSAYNISCIIESTGSIRKRILLIAIPLLVTGSVWVPGYNHLPATALSLLACSLFLRKKMLLVGGCIGLVLFTKLIAFPLPAVFCFAYEVVLWDKNVSIKNFKRIATGFISACAIVIIILFARHELSGYVQTQINNIFYSQGLLVDNSSFANSFASHFRTVFLYMRRGLLLLFTVIISMFIFGYIATQPKVERKTKAFLIGTLAASAFSIIILGLTGIWFHHLSLIYFSQALILICIVISLNSKINFNNLAFGITVVVSAILLSGTPPLSSWHQYIQSPTEISSKIQSLTEDSPETKAFRSIYPNGTEFARLGRNNTVIPHGAVNDKLACPEFHQYYFYSPERLKHILECTKTASTLIVDTSFTPFNKAPNWWPRESQKEIMMKNWNDFVAAGESLIKTQYSCKNLNNRRICSTVRTKTDN